MFGMRRTIYLRVLAGAAALIIFWSIIGHFAHLYRASDAVQALWDLAKIGLFAVVVIWLVPRFEEKASEGGADGGSLPPLAEDERHLTTRELQVLKLVAEGQTSKQIGQTLYISPKTVERHRSTIVRKIGAAETGQPPLVAMTLYAVKLGLVEV